MSRATPCASHIMYMLKKHRAQQEKMKPPVPTGTKNKIDLSQVSVDDLCNELKKRIDK